MGAKRKAARSHKTFNHNNVVELNSFTKKKQSVTIIPRNKNQEQYVLKLLDSTKDIVFGIGPAGTGKTLLAVQVAVKLFKEGKVDKIIVTRPAVSVDEDLGHLPGTLEQKMAPWTRDKMPDPMGGKRLLDYDCKVFYKKDSITVPRKIRKPDDIRPGTKKGKLDRKPIWVVKIQMPKKLIVDMFSGQQEMQNFNTEPAVDAGAQAQDEMQNATPNQMKMLLTRLGEGSKMAVTGDLAQADRIRDNGLINFTKLLRNSDTSHLDIVRFAKGDIERHNAVKEVLQVYGDE